MNKSGKADGNIAGLGAIIGIFIAVLIGLVVLPSIANNTSATTTTFNVVNETITAGANNTAVTIGTGIQAISSYTVHNATAGTIVYTEGVNYTITNYVISNGQLVAQIKAIGNGDFASKPINLSYTAEPYGYITNGGGRSMANLIVLFSALAIALVAILMAIRGGFLENLGLK